MTITIEEGKKYRATNGEIFGPMVRISEDDESWPFTDNSYGRGVPCWRVDGAIGMEHQNSSIDLIAEVVETPETDIKAHIADTAKSIVSGARRSAYGTPEQNFERIAALWSGYATARGWGITFTATDVSPLMILMKLARLAETPDHLDSAIDGVGYFLTLAEVNGIKKDA